MMLAYCPQNETLTQPWVNDGLCRCFTDTISTTLLAILIILPGSGVIYFRKKYGSPIPQSSQSTSRWWSVQQTVCWFIPVLLFTQLMVFAFIRADEKIYGFIIYELILHPVSWILSIFVMRIDCNRPVPSSHYRRHTFVLLCFWSGALVCSLLPLASVRSTDWWWTMKSSKDIVEFVLWLLMVICVATALILGVLAPGLPRSPDAYAFLQSEGPSAPPRLRSTWSQGYQRFKIVAPFIWPGKNRCIRLRVLLCVAILAIGRVVNVYTPIFYKRIVDSLTVPTNQTLNSVEFIQPTFSFTQRIVTAIFGSNGLIFRWDYVLQFMALRFLQGMGGVGGGLIAVLRSQLWVAVDQYSTRELSVMLFGHLQNLSLQWHLSRKTGEMLRIMDRGTASISNVLSYFVFNILPTFLDIGIGVAYFVTVFNVWYGLLVFVTMALYMGITMVITDWRTKLLRAMNEADNQKSTKAVDALLNFETVKYFNAEQFEVGRFKQAFLDYQHCEWLTQTSLNLLNLTQTMTITLGLFIGTILCARDVILGRLTVGDFVLFNTYLLQLYAPLSLFGTYYRLLQSSVVAMENMFELLEVNQDIKDNQNAIDLVTEGGEIEFKDVCFHYTEDRPILKHVSFKVPAGKTVALVGQSGAGKSTIVRLLFRFYDVTAGEIHIDGQNIAHVTQRSLRKAIGVVPQDTVLFNDTIGYNIRYGRLDASESEVRQAAISADIHNRILEFYKAYDTVVGERGLKLSGGEKQRVAIARNFLKNPHILMLDEATSALDTATERTIQASLNNIARNRTTLVVAHRLSTITHADEILMMHQGEIIERGTHDELLTIPGGRYAELWHAQSRAHSEPNGSQGQYDSDPPAIDDRKPVNV